MKDIDMETQTDESDKTKKVALTRRKLIAQFASAVSVVAAGAAMLTSVNFFFKEPREIVSPATRELVVLHDLSTSIEQDRKKLQDALRQVEALIDTDRKPMTGQQVAAVKAQIKSIDSRLDILEKGLLDSPDKALSVPLLRNDLQNLKLSYKQDLDNMAKAIDRVYDQNKWFIGLMFTMAL